MKAIDYLIYMGVAMVELVALLAIAEFISKLVEKKKTTKGIHKEKDTGLRGTFGGRLYVDKKVFYRRKDVQNTINEIKNSESIKEYLEKIKINK